MAEFPELKDRLLVVYDGQCGLCNRWVRWMLRRDGYDRLRFAPSNSPVLQQLLASHGALAYGSGSISGSGPDTILVFRNIGTPVEELLVRSNGFLACLHLLPQPWPALAGLLRLVPRPLRESGYKLIARHRYRIWGRYTTCPIPTAEERLHFLEQRKS